MQTIQLTWDEFEVRFKPLQNKITNREEFSGWLFETYDDDLSFVKTINETQPRNVWTILDSDGLLSITNGFHLINRVGYVLTTVPAPDNIDYYVVDPDDEQDTEYELEVEDIIAEMGYDRCDLEFDMSDLHHAMSKNLTPQQFVDDFFKTEATEVPAAEKPETKTIKLPRLPL